MPDGECKSKPIKLDIKTHGHLQKMAYLCLNSLLEGYASAWEMLGITKEKGYLENDEYSNYEWIFKEQYTDEELAGIINYEEAMIQQEKTMKGKLRIERPRLGRMVHGFIKAGGKVLASLGYTDKYCLIGDLMLATGAIQLDERGKEDWQAMNRSEKAMKVFDLERNFLDSKASEI